jgi:hypothetical protein
MAKGQITITKNGESFTYANFNQAVKSNGATSGMNTKAAVKYLTKCGFDMSSIEINANANAKPATKSSIVAQVEKLCKTIDVEKIKAKQAQVDTLVKNLKSNANIQPIIDLQNEIENLKNPKIDDVTIMNKFQDLLIAYRANQENETE